MTTKAKWIFSCVILVTQAFTVSAFAAELKPPKLGTQLTWECTGPFAQQYKVEITQIKDGIVLYQGSVDRDTYWVEKSAALTGTTLWSKKIGERYQWWDKEDFEGFRKLKSGTRFKGAVPAQEGNDKWVWQYVITVGQPRRAKHRVLGDVALVPVSERRRVLHGKYWSNNTSYVHPELGISVSWTYEDARGQEECDLVELGRGGSSAGG